MRAQFLVAAAALLLAACGNQSSSNADDADDGGAQYGEPQMDATNGAPPGQMPPQGGAKALPKDAIRLRPAQIVDPSGFERPMTAATILVPAGWKAQGGVVWNVQAQCGSGYQFQWNATAPDGATGAQIIPGVAWSMNNFGAPTPPGCPPIRADNAHDYLGWLVQTQRPGARILDFRPRPDLLKSLKQLEQNTPTAMGSMRTWVDAGEVLIAYNNNGADERESIAAVVVFSSSNMQNPAGGTMNSLSAQALPAYAFHAPNGQLNFKLAELIRSSFKLDPQWQARINKSQAQMNATALRESRKRSQIIAQTGNEISDMQMKGWEERNAIQDHMQRETSEAIRGVETYNDPQSTTGTVELSNQYNDAYRLNDGSYVLTDDPSFNPYAATGQDGTKLEPTQ